jgi:hypothetical protein
MRKTRRVAAVFAVVWTTWAGAQARGGGVGWTGGEPPVTKSAGPEAERAANLQQQPPQFARALGLLGAAGAASDPQGPWRLGRYGRASWPSIAPSYGEAAQLGPGGGSSYEAWKSGDLVRSTSAADVRAARGQQAPDLEWTGAQASANEGNETYGKQYQHEQEKAKR